MKGLMPAVLATLLALQHAGVGTQSAQAVPDDGPPVTVVLVIDTSESTAYGRREHFVSQYREVPEALPLFMNAARTLLDALRPDDEVGLVTFGNHVTLAAPVKGDVDAVRHALDDVRPAPEHQAYPKSFVLDAVTAGITLAGAKPGRSLVVLLTDGGDNASWSRTDDVTDLAKSLGVGVVVISAPRTSDTRDFHLGMENQPIDVLRHRGASEIKASDRRLPERIRERLRLLRLSGRK